MLELDSGNANTKNFAATYYGMLGQFDLSLELINQAIQLDLITSDYRRRKTYILMSIGRFDEAKHAVQDLLEIHTEHRSAPYLQAKTLLLAGDDERGSLC